MSPVFRHGRLRLYLLKLLDEAPRHGYEVIRLLQDRFMGIYAPSPGTIYPRLARLEEEGLVTHDEADGRKVYRITDKGREELRARLDDLAELEEEITASVRDIAREVTEDVRDTVRTLREELSWATREFHAKAHQAPGGADPGGDARHARTDEARARAEATRAREAAAKTREAAAKTREATAKTREATAKTREATAKAWEVTAKEQAARAKEDAERAPQDADQAMGSAAWARADVEQAAEDAQRATEEVQRATAEAQRAVEEAQHGPEAERPATEDARREEEPAGSGAPHDRDRPGRDWHEEAHDRSGRRRGEREWGEWAGWTGWGGWPGAAGQHDWADPEAYRDLERLAKQFSRELRSAAWHAQAVSEDALRDLRGILDETIDRIKAEVFRGKTPPGDPGDSAPPAD
jgi:DNA-binding PadR family transcriptional regulator